MKSQNEVTSPKIKKQLKDLNGNFKLCLIIYTSFHF